MMLVKTIVKPSTIEGLGLFADQDIPQGTPVWQFTPGFDALIEPQSLAQLPQIARDQFMKYAYLSKKSGKHVLCFDDARFFNHDANPNISCAHSAYAVAEEDICLANRKITRGQELTCNYREFDAGPPEPFISV
jgi:SET domain-containing protein